MKRTKTSGKRTAGDLARPHAAIIHTTKQYAAWREKIGMTWREAAESGIRYARAAKAGRRAHRKLIERADAVLGQAAVS